MSETSAKLRIDKWLWYARVAKTRSLAAKLVTSGKVRLNKDKVSATKQTVKVEDVLTIVRGEQIIIYKVVALGTRRGPAPEAQLLFEDLSPVVEKRSSKTPIEDRHGRPTKRDRREIMRFKRSHLDD